MAESTPKPVSVNTADASVTIDPYGAHITSWKVGGEEIMFVSKLAKHDGSRPIRGGVPLVFPQFGPGPIKQHGFARRCYWTLKETSQDDNVATIVFTLSPNEYTLDMWPNQFLLTYTVKIQGSDITMDFTVKNTSETTYDFTCLLHTYYCLKDVKDVEIKGLTGKKYLDSLLEKKEFTETRESVTIAENVDRIYLDVEWPVSFHNGSKTVSITANVSDCVVWNPWKAKAEAMGDFADTEYFNMVCVEPGAATKAVTLPAGEEYTMTSTFTVS